MMKRSTAMFLAACALLVPVNGYSLTEGKGVYDNTENAKELFSRAVALDGNFKIYNGETGATMTYMHNSQPNIWPAEDPLEEILKMIEGIDDSSASQTFGLISDSDNAVRIRFNDGDKCISAQWDLSYGVDLYGAAYECAVGSGSQSDTGLRDAKQWFILDPVETSSGHSSGSSSSGSSSSGHAAGSGSQSASGTGNSGSSSGSSSSSSSGSSSGGGIPCEKTPTWVYDHPPATHKDFYDVHPECLGTAAPPPCDHSTVWLQRHATPEYLKEHPYCQAKYNAGKRDTVHSQRMMPHKRALENAEKRGETVGHFRIVLTDHINDMRTRCLVSEKTSAFNDMLSAGIGMCDTSDPKQTWTFERV